MNYPLKDLDAEFTSYEGVEAGMMFRCPNCREYGGVHFPGKYVEKYPSPVWTRTGDTLETLTLHPSVRMIGHFHSWIKNGELQVDSPFECKARTVVPEGVA